MIATGKGVICAVLAAMCFIAPGSAQTSAGAGVSADVPHEDIEWVDIWVPDTGVSNLPHVLLIGDSITRAYYKFVAEQLKGKAVVAQLATSKCAGDPLLPEQISLVLKDFHFDVIQINNGMHGVPVSDAIYAKGMAELISRVRQEAPKAKLVLVTTTPVREPGALEKLSPRTEQVKSRNKTVVALATEQQIPVDDLFALILDHPEYYSKDGIHSNETGSRAEAEQVARSVEKMLQ